VIVAGRRQQLLDEMRQANPGMRSFLLDVTDAEAVREVARKAIAEFPALNCVFNNAGVQRGADFTPGQTLDERAILAEINTNILGVIRVASAFLPHLATRPAATLVNVSSGLAFVPMARYAVYCATKAAVHSWTLSLRHQLRNSNVKVRELIPPWVATELGGMGKPAQTPAGGNQPMPLAAFIAETMKELETDAEEIAIADAKRLAAAASPDTVKTVFSRMNS
jgi:uncharacterized oxidoreductase